MRFSPSTSLSYATEGSTCSPAGSSAATAADGTAQGSGTRRKCVSGHLAVQPEIQKRGPLHHALPRRGIGEGTLHGGGQPTAGWTGCRHRRLQREALVRPAGLCCGLCGWPPDLHLQKRLHLRGLSRINATLPVTGIKTDDRERFFVLRFCKCSLPFSEQPLPQALRHIQG